jgi:penicillin-insensitive murein endopeptidase
MFNMETQTKPSPALNPLIIGLCNLIRWAASLCRKGVKPVQSRLGGACPILNPIASPFPKAKVLALSIGFGASLGLPSLAPHASDWSRVETPAEGPPRSVGETNSGCVAGAFALPLEGKGYQVMHIERNRYWGHPDLVRAIKLLGQKSAQRNLGVVQVGDLGQPRGGPLPFGHRSHQSGLDVDVWFNLDPKILTGANAMRSDVNAPSMLNASKTGVDRDKWTSDHVTMLELAANLPGVDRIFVNPYIKKELCESVAGDRAWLRVIRPWYNHDDHFHMRLSCPANSPACREQEPTPTGEGCDSSLDWWFQQPTVTTPKPHPAPRPQLPAECRDILVEP